MGLHETILTDLNQAMKQRDAETLSVLRLLKAALLNMQKETGSSDLLKDEEVIAALQREAKKRKESAESFQSGGRNDLAETELKELVIIERYLPEQMSDEDILAMVNEVIGDTAPDMSQFGALMGNVMKKVAGQADGNRVRSVLQKRLQS